MVEGGLPENVPRRLGRYDVVSVLALARTPVRSTVVIAKARDASASAPPGALGSALALSYSPLAPNEGTTTFQKPVAIKIIAPALAKDEKRLEAFLATARSVVEVKHPSIAPFYEVGQAGTDVYLVMDYLAGETAATLMRQLHARGETLDYKLAAHIIAEAAGGLDAAHAAGILHEQLTPHDLFVGYDGTVRVLDIGIAAARSWLASESGDVGLGVEYSSPERCKKEPLDRRTDVFSLGTMLWELNTGISPFERAKKADTMRAICEERILPPHHVVPGLPESLSMITMKALERDKDERYPSTLALRQALVGQRRGGTAVESPALDLSKLMKRLFERRFADKSEMLQRIHAGKSIAGLDVRDAEGDAAPVNRLDPPIPASLAAPVIVPPAAPKSAMPPATSTKATATSTKAPGAPAQAAASISVAPPKSNPPPLVELDAPSVIIAPESTRDAALAPPAPAAARTPFLGAAPFAEDTAAIDGAPVPGIPGVPSSKSLVGLLIAGVALLLVLGTIALAFGFRKGSASATPQPSIEPATTAALPAAANAGTAASAPSAASAPTAASAAVVDDPPVYSAAPANGAGAAEEVVLHIETVPSHAPVFIAGNRMGISPLDLRMPKRRDTVTLEIRHAGFQTLKERVVPDQNQRLKLTLVAAAGSGAPATAPYHKFQ